MENNKPANDSQELEKKCAFCNGQGRFHGRECEECDGAGYIVTELGKRIRELMRHNFRAMLKETIENQ
jgi:DnaJ-class molecular chaperone